MKRALSLILSLAMIFSSLCITGITLSAETVSGTCGDNLTWTLDTETGVLTIDGNGKMNDGTPWNSYSDYIQEVIIGNSVTSIGSLAFSSCMGLTSVTIPDSVTSIGDNAFCYRSQYGYYHLPDLIIKCNKDSYAHTYAKNRSFDYVLLDGSVITGKCGENLTWMFDETTGVLEISGEGDMYDGSNSTWQLSCITEVLIGDAVTSIGSAVFQSCTHIRSITIPDSVTSIGDSAFAYCYGLERISIGEAVETIGKGAFYECSQLSEINLPDSLKSIGADAFYECMGLKSIAIPESVTEISSGLFYFCTGLKSITLPDTLKKICNGAFTYCDSLEDPEIPASVTEIGSWAFSYCWKISDIKLPEGIISIGEYAFQECSIKEVTIPASVTSIGSRAFDSSSVTIKCYENSYAHTYAVDNEIPFELLHTCVFTSYTSDNNYTCTEDGTKTAYCDNGCGATDTVVDEGSAAHRYTTEEILREPTCASQGYKLLFCDCGARKTEVIAEADHVFTVYTYNNNASCTEDGTESAFCDYGCGILDTRSLKGTMIEHKFTDYVYNNDATCTADGTESASCDYGCGIIDTVTAKGTMIAHNYSSEVTLEPTCTAEGIETYTCTGCSDRYDIAIPVIPHSYAEEILEESTCSTHGLALYVCDCNAFYKVDLPLEEHPYGDWTTVTAPTDFTAGEEQRVCSACGSVESREIPVLPKPEISVDNYIVTISNADYIKDMRYAPGEYTTTAEIKAAEGNVALSNSIVTKNTVDGSFVYTMPNGGYFTIWVRMQDDRSYILPLDLTSITPSVTANGVTVTLHDLYNVKDFYVAEGEFETYREIKDNGYVFSATSAKIGTRHDYTCTVKEPGVHTILIRYNDGTTALFHETLTVEEPVFITNGLQVTISNIPDVKVIRTAYGEYTTPGDTKRAAGARNFSNKSVIRNAESYMIQYREEGRVTITVEYNNGYVKVFHYDVVKKAPTVEQYDNAVTFGKLDGLKVIRYAVGEYATASEIKNAPGSKYRKPDAIVDGKITISDLIVGETYTFCVQYDDESYYFCNNGNVIKDMKINGNDISRYTIVYSENEIDSVAEAASDLQLYIEKATGASLPIVTDASSVSQYEILVGKTNREEKGAVSADRSFEDDQTYTWSVQGNYLVITGVDSDVDNGGIVNVNGTLNAVFMFGREVLNVREYIDDGELVVSIPGASIDIPDGYYHEDTVIFRTRTFYMKGSVNSSGQYKYTYSVELGDAYSGTPCLSDKGYISILISNVGKELSSKNYSRVNLSIADSPSYCTCTSCTDIYRQYSARSATLVLLVNTLAETYPDVEFVLCARDYASKPPRSITLRDNVIVEIYTISKCPAHDYDDTSCSMNNGFINDWGVISNGLSIEDNSGNFIYFLTPMPDWDSLLTNIRSFADAGAREICINSVFYGEDLPNGESPEINSDFGAVRAYMLSVLYMDPYMTEDEYYKELDGCLRAHYGDGWTYIREYLDIIAEAGNNKCHSFLAHPSGWYDNTEVAKIADYVDSLWESAKAVAESEELNRIELAEPSWAFLRQCATYDSMYTNGTEDQRAEYIERNEELYNAILDLRLLWTEGTLNPLDNYMSTTVPSNW